MCKKEQKIIRGIVDSKIYSYFNKDNLLKSRFQAYIPQKYRDIDGKVYPAKELFHIVTYSRLALNCFKCLRPGMEVILSGYTTQGHQKDKKPVNVIQLTKFEIVDKKKFSTQTREVRNETDNEKFNGNKKILSH